MLNLALSAIKDTLEGINIAGTPLIEKYGGLVFPLSIPEQIGSTDSGQPILREKTFPVACGVTFEACVGQRKYQELVPNSRYRSIAYWEQLSDAALNTAESSRYPKSNVVVYDIQARLVVWLNMGKFNLNGEAASQCSIAAPVALKIQEVLLNGKREFQIDNPAYENAGVRLIFQGQERKDAKTAFGQYSYGQETAKFMLFPYDFLVLRYTVRLRIPRQCVTAFTIGEALDCVVNATEDAS